MQRAPSSGSIHPGWAPRPGSAPSRPGSAPAGFVRSQSAQSLTQSWGGLSRASSRSSFRPFQEDAQRQKRMQRIHEQADQMAELLQRQIQEKLLRARVLPRPQSAAQLPAYDPAFDHVGMYPHLHRDPSGFIYASAKAKAKPGYVYKLGSKGYGYYKDYTYVAPRMPTAKELREIEAATRREKEEAKKKLAPRKKEATVYKTHEEKFQAEKETKMLLAAAESGLNSRFTDMYKAFQYCDLDRSGRLSRSEIRRALDLWNIPIDDRQLDLLLGEIDEDGDDGISYEEFVDKLARGTVANAAMGKRGLQSLEAMGVAADEVLAIQLKGGTKITKYSVSINS